MGEDETLAAGSQPSLSGIADADTDTSTPIKHPDHAEGTRAIGTSKGKTSNEPLAALTPLVVRALAAISLIGALIGLGTVLVKVLSDSDLGSSELIIILTYSCLLVLGCPLTILIAGDLRRRDRRAINSTREWE